jgi:hypothetical protein
MTTSQEDLIKSLESRFERMRQYLLLKYEEEDWHGVMDAAADIREIVVQLKLIKSIKLQKS